MPEDADSPPAEPPADKQAGEDQGGKEKDESPLNVATKVAQGLNNKLAELKEFEARLDKKVNDFKKFVAETEVEGKTFAGKPPMSAEEKAIADAKKLLEGTGLDF